MFVNRTTASDFSGSATVLVSIALHLGHSEVRSSDPSGKGVIRASLIRARHLQQRGRSIDVRRMSNVLGINLLACISQHEIDQPPSLSRRTKTTDPETEASKFAN
ncbi:MAG: hypothetical protein H0V72_07760 [Bradyrhizobium sp.]|nr:hypothetical protein [Bradyrhizobium sp.]